MFERSAAWVRRAVEERQIPSAALCIGVGDRVMVSEAHGVTAWTGEGRAVDADTLYDMASCSKVMATTMIALRMIARGELDLADTLPRYFGDEVPPDKRNVTIAHLMTHTSGFNPHFLLEDATAGAPEDAVRALLREPLVSPVGAQVHYSCMGYILLGLLLERAAGARLDELARREVFEPLGMTRTGYHPLDRPIDARNTAYTERRAADGAWLCGRVHDENAFFLNGIAGNAGVFSTLTDCARFARMLAGHGTLEGRTYLPRCIFDEAIRNHTPGMEENRGLGFHLANGYQSYTGAFFDQRAFGHTGFTGTHFCVSPETGLFVVLLTNRVHPTRENAAHLRIRRVLHTLVQCEYAG